MTADHQRTTPWRRCLGLLLVLLHAAMPAAVAAMPADAAARYWCGPGSPDAQTRAAVEAVLAATGEAPQPVQMAIPDCPACASETVALTVPPADPLGRIEPPGRLAPPAPAARRLTARPHARPPTRAPPKA